MTQTFQLEDSNTLSINYDESQNKVTMVNSKNNTVVEIIPSNLPDFPNVLDVSDGSNFEEWADKFTMYEVGLFYSQNKK